MFRTALLSWICLSIVVAGGCGSSTDDPAESGNPGIHDSGAATARAGASWGEYMGPGFTFEVETEESPTQFGWSVTVPTGGWEMKFDGTQTDPGAGHAIIKITLTRPGPDELVTQALVTHSDDYRDGNVAFNGAELVVRVVIRGESPDDVEYGLAGKWKSGG